MAKTIFAGEWKKPVKTVVKTDKNSGFLISF